MRRNNLPDLYKRYVVEDRACERAMQRLENGRFLGRLIGKVQLALHETARNDLACEMEVAELYPAISQAEPLASSVDNG